MATQKILKTFGMLERAGAFETLQHRHVVKDAVYHMSMPADAIWQGLHTGELSAD